MKGKRKWRKLWKVWLLVMSKETQKWTCDDTNGLIIWWSRRRSKNCTMTSGHDDGAWTEKNLEIAGSVSDGGKRTRRQSCHLGCLHLEKKKMFRSVSMCVWVDVWVDGWMEGEEAGLPPFALICVNTPGLIMPHALYPRLIRTRAGCHGISQRFRQPQQR